MGASPDSLAIMRDSSVVVDSSRSPEIKDPGSTPMCTPVALAN